MPSYHDLNIANKELAERALKLGWRSATAARAVELRGQKDIPRAASGGITIVEGANTELLRQACRREGVSLVNPFKIQQYYKDDGLIRAVAENGKAFEVPLSEIVRTTYVYRARFLSQARAFLQRCVKRRAGFVLTSRAREEWDLKSPREAIALGVALGLSREQAGYSISARAEEILEKAGVKVD